MLAVSPSLSIYSSTRFAEIASKAVEAEDAAAYMKQISGDPPVEDEFSFHHRSQRGEEDEDLKQISHDPPVEDDFSFHHRSQRGEEDEDDDFEFSFVPQDPHAIPISADDIFSNDQIQPTYPILNGDLVFSASDGSDKINPDLDLNPSVHLPMWKLLSDDRKSPSSERLPAGKYSIWTSQSPRSASPDRRKKSNSTGSSKAWRFSDLMHRRSGSNAQDTLLFLSTDEIKGEEKKGGKKESKREDNQRPLTPRKKTVVGFFANVSGLSKRLNPF